jgi:hypothetical protein
VTESENEVTDPDVQVPSKPFRHGDRVPDEPGVAQIGQAHAMTCRDPAGIVLGVLAMSCQRQGGMDRELDVITVHPHFPAHGLEYSYALRAFLGRGNKIEPVRVLCRDAQRP